MYKLIVPLSALSDAATASAIARLFLALEGSAAAPVTVIAPHASAPTTIASPEPAAPATPSFPSAAVPAAPVSPPAPKSAATRAADWAAFEAGLPERSKAFLDLLRAEGQVSLPRAMEALGLTEPKAMGGITGSIGRWAPARGLSVPFAAFERGGERAWRWIGTANAPAAAPAAEPPRAAVIVAGEVPLKRKPGRPLGSKSKPKIAPPSAPVPVTDALPSDKPPPRPERPKIAEPAAAATPAAQPAKPRGRPGPKPKFAVLDPFSDAVVEPLKPVVPAETAAERARALSEGELAQLEGLVSGLPEPSQRFMRLLREHGQFTMAQAMDVFQLGRPQAIGGVIEPIQRVSRAAGLPLAFHTAFDDKGEKRYVWPALPPPPEGVRRRPKN